MFKALRNFDAYAKPLDDFRVKTATGAAVTILSGFIITVLILTEFVDYQMVHMKPSLIVDKSRKEKMKINVNVTFPSIPCFLLNMDVMDVSGEHQVNVHHTIYKSRLDEQGNEIEKTKSHLSDNVKKNETNLPDNYCGPCYGGETPKSGCCQTCEDVEQAYIDKGWSLNNHNEIEQCIREGYDAKVKEQEHEGCNIHGHVEVNKVAGNFHFSPGKSYQQGSLHIHQFKASQFPRTRYSHTIHELSFGEAINFVNPLDGVAKKSDSLVGTEINYMSGKSTSTNQFSVTEHEKDVTPLTVFSAPDGLPGVFFSYEISPMLVIYREEKKQFAHFLTDICAIVGGIFTVAGMIDGFIWSAEKALKKKMELGKAH